MPSLIFLELREESLGVLAVAAYPSRVSPLRFFSKAKYHQLHHNRQRQHPIISSNTTTINITTAKIYTPFRQIFLRDAPVEAAIAPH
jgi:hypothetical protein